MDIFQFGGENERTRKRVFLWTWTWTLPFEFPSPFGLCGSVRVIILRSLQGQVQYKYYTRIIQVSSWLFCIRMVLICTNRYGVEPLVPRYLISNSPRKD